MLLSWDFRVKWKSCLGSTCSWCNMTSWACCGGTDKIIIYSDTKCLFWSLSLENEKLYILIQNIFFNRSCVAWKRISSTSSRNQRRKQWTSLTWLGLIIICLAKLSPKIYLFCKYFKFVRITFEKYVWLIILKSTFANARIVYYVFSKFFLKLNK